MKKISLVAIIISAALAACHGKKADNTAKPPAGDMGSSAPPAGSGDAGSAAGGGSGSAM